MKDNPLVHGAKDEGERPTVQSLRNRLRTEYEQGKDAAPRPKKSWLKRKAKATDKPVEKPIKTAENTPVKPEHDVPDRAPASRWKSWLSRRKARPAEKDGKTPVLPDSPAPAPAPKPEEPGKIIGKTGEVEKPAKKRRRLTRRLKQSAARIKKSATQKRIQREKPTWLKRINDKKQPNKDMPAWRARLKADAKRKPQPEQPVLDSQEFSDTAETRFNSLLDIFKEGLRLPTPIIVASIVSSLLGLALPLSVLQIYDRILPNQSTETLALLTLGLFGAFALDAILKILRSYLLGWNAVRHGFNAQLTAVTRLLRAPHANIEKEPPAVWVDGLEAVRELSAFEGGQSRLLTLDIPLAGIFLIVLGLVGGPLILVPILLIVGFGAFAAFHGKRLQDVLANRTDQDNRKHDFLIECLTGVHTLKGLAMEPMIQRRFERLQKGSALVSYDTILLGNKMQSMGIMFANLMMISVVSVGALMVMGGELSVGGLACCSLLSGRLTQPVMRGVGMWTEFQNIQLAQERAGKFASLQASFPDENFKAPDITGAIAFNDVGFTYPGAKAGSGLSGISMRINPGEFVGIKGEDGSGRSTLVKLITGELQATSGSVVIEGLESCPNREQLQVRDVAYVSAQSATFKGTILENIAMFRSGQAIQDAQEAAKLIGVENEIHRLPDGYDTLLAQGVSQALSSGLLQRIVIARALARKPKILIFDEANTLLDFRSDQLLREGLEQLKGSMTAIIISNRPSFLSVSDRLYALEGGTLVPQESAPKQDRAPVAKTQGTAA